MKVEILCCLIVSGVFLISTPSLAASCDAAEEGSRHDIFYHVTGQQVSTVTWYHQQGPFPTTLARCDTARDDGGTTFTCKSQDPSKYEIQESNNRSNFTLTILSVSRVGLMPYLFSVNGIQVFSCILDVYAKPESPRCQPPTLTPDNTALSVTCSTDKVFPQAQCVFHRQNVQGDLSDVSYTQVNYNTSDGITYYRSSCTLTYPVNTTGSYAFVVDMFVVLYNVQYGKVQSPASDSISLTLPEGSLADCPSGGEIQDGYIKQGTTTTCRCDRIHDGLPVGQVQWYNSGGQEVGTGGVSATLTIPTDDTEQNFTCKGKSLLGVQPTGRPFSLKIAYGPTQVTINPGDSTSTTIDLCPNTNKNVNIQCQVPRDDISPHPNFTVNFNATSQQGNQGSDVYTYTVTNTLNTAGTLIVTCRAVNSLFDDLSKEGDLQITVREPPSSPPLLIINNNQPVVENVPFTVNCRVDGGFPLVSGVTVLCRSDHNMTSNTNVVSQSLTVSREMDGVQCDCVAQHVTGCYSNNQATAKLNVTYQAAIKTFTVNDVQSLTVNLHDSINLTCVTDGNPTPTIIIQNHRATDQKIGEGHRLTYFKDDLSCTDTAVYICQVTNFVTTDKTSDAQLQIFVRCPQQPQHNENPNFPATEGDSATVNLDVMGYPAPILYTLTQEDKVVARVIANNGNGGIGPYQFKYLSHDPPLATVQLTFGNVSQDDFTNYRLTIDNGVGQANVLTFQLEKAEVLTPDTDTTSDTDILPIAIGVSVGVVVLLILVIIIVLKRRGLLKLPERTGQRGTLPTEAQAPPKEPAFHSEASGAKSSGTDRPHAGQGNVYPYENTAEDFSLELQENPPNKKTWKYENVTTPTQPDEPQANVYDAIDDTASAYLN